MTDAEGVSGTLMNYHLQFIKDKLMRRDDNFIYIISCLYTYSSQHEELWQGASLVWPDIL